MNTHYLSFKTRVCWITLIGDENAISKINFEKTNCHDLKPANKIDNFKLAKSEIIGYFAGEIDKFSFKTTLATTPFQTKVLKALQKIRRGSTMCYSEIAEKIGNPKAARAVGLANNKNPLPLVYPCHRVIGKNGKLVGFGGGLDVKRELLKLEGADFI